MKKIRVLVVDDSALMRKLIPQILSSDPEIEVIGTAMDGIFALAKIGNLKPDVITLDLSMPRMDGIKALRHIMDDYGTPTIIVSSLTQNDTELTFQALEIGAFDFVTKPQSAISVHLNEIGDELIKKVKAAYANPHLKSKIKKVRPVISRKGKKTLVTRKTADKALAIGISTGGPNALTYLLPQIPKEFPAAILIAQHMPPGFTKSFAKRLNALCDIEVKEANDGDLVLPGRVLIAPGDRHLKVMRRPLGAIAVLSKSSPMNGHRPSADVLFSSVAETFGKNVTGLIMTGMGNDGAEGIGEIMARGGVNIAQDEKSCVVFGMPKIAIEKKYIKHIVSLEKMGNFLINHFTSKEV
jgi:two-component system chemotaxis response regulator CheB